MRKMYPSQVFSFAVVLTIVSADALLPSVAGYLNHVWTSMAPQMLLMENRDTSSGNVMLLVLHGPCWN
jgi:hypothetical protein